MGNLNKIFNSLNVVSEGTTYSTIGLLVSKSGTTANPGVTSFVVRDDSKTGVNTILPTSMLTVSGDCRITDLPTGGSLMVTSDVTGKLHTSVIPVIGVDPNCAIVSATSINCVLTLINCTGGTITADTCNTFGSTSPYEYGIATMGIQPILGSPNTDASFSNIGGGLGNKVDFSSVFSNIGGGVANTLTGSSFTFIGGGEGIHISKSSHSSIVGGFRNNLTNVSPASAILGGYMNTMSGSSWSNISGGYKNTINDVQGSSILGGINNVIDNTYWSTILCGDSNLINNSGSVLGHNAIVNGTNNTVSHVSSAIIGGANLTTNRQYTTFMEGLDVDSNRGGNTNAQAFKYHGTWAQPGLNFVLTDIDGSGNAQWQPGGVIQSDRNCPIVSATSNNCILTLINCTGGTITADTCNTFGSTSPYEIGAGAQSIQPILGSPFSQAAYSNIGGGLTNLIDGGSSYSNIGGGHGNDIVADSAHSFIGGGKDNYIYGSPYSSVVGGKDNKISSSQYSSIVGGSDNTVNNTYSAIIGSKNKTTNRPYTTFMEGLDVDSNRGGNTNAQAFKYYGTFASPGINRVLTDVDGGGNAVWMELPGFPVVTGCSITGVTVSNCVGTYTTDCGTTITADTCDGSYSPYRPTGGVNSITTTLAPNPTFQENIIDITSDYSTISAGMHNKITNDSSWSNVVGGITNYIDQSRLSAIVTGRDNLISVPGGTSAGHGVIINGAYNIVNHSHSVIMGGENITTNRQNTVFMNGLDVFTNASTVFGGASQQPFKYHGTFANPGLGKILMDVDGSGNAVWAKGGIVQTDPKCAIVSATSDNCILTLINCTGGTLTADTCGVYSGPYRTGAGTNSIEPVVGSSFSNGQYTNVGGGLQNVTDQTSYYSNIDGGTSNFISGGTGNAIGGGMSNTIKGGMVGVGNPAAQCIITGGFSNVIDSTNAATINGGGENVIKNLSWYSSVGGYQSTMDGSFYSTIGNGKTNTINISHYSVIGGGLTNKVFNSSNYSSIGGGYINTISGSSQASIVGGVSNEINDSNNANIGGGNNNHINENSLSSFIANGQSNSISASTYSSIVGGTGGVIEGTQSGSIIGGQNNHIHSADFSTIINGHNNNITHDHSVILGTANRTTSLSYTTYLDGLDIDSVGQGGARYLKYHGALANPGINKVLTSIDNLGNAVWGNPAGVSNLTGDEVVVSAQTIGCILTLTTNSGNTITANTCTTYSSPYTNGQGTDNIRPVAPGGGLLNTTHIISAYNGIQSGYMNHIGKLTYRSTILGGNSNSMSGSNYSTIVGGAVNSIIDSTGGVIVNGSSNKILSGVDGSAIIGTSGVEAYTDNTTYTKHQQVHGKTRISSEEYNDTNSLNTRLAVMTLDVVHDTSTINAVAQDASGGEIVRFGSTGSGYAKGALVQLRAGTWELAKNTDTTKQGHMLGIALSNNPSNEGVLIRGFSKPDTFNSISANDIGQPIYVGATAGNFTTTVPTGKDNYLRVVGYQVRSIDGGIPMYFNPESTYITIK